MAFSKYLFKSFDGHLFQRMAVFSLPNKSFCTVCRVTTSKPLSAMPGPHGLPYFGTYFRYKWGSWPVKNYHLTLSELYKTFGSLVKETRCGKTVVHIFEPDHARVVFQVDGKTPYILPLMETTQVYREQREMSPGLGNTNGDNWQRLRSAVSPFMLRPEKLANALLEVIDETAQEAISWFSLINQAEGSVTHLEKKVSIWQIESAAMTVLHRRLGFFKNPSFGYRLYEGNRNVFQLTAKLKHSLPLFKYFPSFCPSFRKLSHEEDVVFGTGQLWLDEAWEQYHSMVEINSEEAALSWPVLHNFTQRTELSKSERDIICLGMLFDGLSTTSPTVLGLLYCLANNPFVQEKAAKEARIALEKGHGKLCYDSLASQLTYIRACIKEATRVFTITTDISRIPQKDVVVGGYFIPAGTEVEINTHSLFHDSNFIPGPPGPSVFAPERWLRQGEPNRKQPHPFLVLPFGHGARMCAGRRLAEMEMMVLLCRLLSRYHIRWTGDAVFQQTYETLLYPKGSLSISLEKRA